MTKLVETIHAGAFIVSEAPGFYSRDEMVVAVSQSLLPGQPVGAKGVAADITATASADAANTADSGTIAMDGTAPIAATAKNGRYVGVCSAATKVNWEDPYGKAIGVSTHGAAFTGGGIKFTITAGSSPNVVGDKFYVDVVRESVSDEQIVAWDPTATDGSEVICGIPVYPVTTSASATAKVAVLRRMAEVRASDLTWPDGISAANKARGIEQLRAIGIVCR